MSARYVSFEEFAPVLEWLTCQRPESRYARFSLFRVGFDNPEVLGSTFGASDAMRRLNQFGNMLAATVRRADLVARDLTVFWVLTSECNAEMVVCRLCEIVSGVQDFGLEVVESTVGAYLFPLQEVNLAGAGTRKIIDRLQAMPPHYKFDPAHEDWRARIGNGNCRARVDSPPANS